MSPGLRKPGPGSSAKMGSSPRGLFKGLHKIDTRTYRYTVEVPQLINIMSLPLVQDDTTDFEAAVSFLDSFEATETLYSSETVDLSTRSCPIETGNNQNQVLIPAECFPDHTQELYGGLDPLSADADFARPFSDFVTSSGITTAASSTVMNGQALSEVPKASELKSNPNRARNERRKELRSLRVEAAELKAQLEALQETRRKVRQQNFSSNGGTIGGCWELSRRIWQDTAQRQFFQRMAAVQENKRLTGMIKENANIISKLQCTLRQWSPDSTIRSLDPEVESCLRSYDFDALLNVNVDQLLRKTDSSYQKVDQVFSQCVVDLAAISSCSTPEMRADAAGNLFSQVFGSKIFPFHAQETGRVVWDVVSNCVRPASRCLFNHFLYSTDEVVVESCGTELHANSKELLFHTLQIKRRYKEHNREVIVWQSVVQPILFRGKPLQGASFEESGVFLIYRSPLIPDGFALLQTSYVITPRAPMRQLPTNSLALSVTDFVLEWMAASIPANHQIFEDALVKKGL